ncbi:ABC transporter ATP-binding protein [Vibrio sp. 1CM23M]|uniref:ABC transporter ATP-binding protein n=1 Tax=Vibrio sp. 1CM23M TaxID=2929164 RepID=UPI0020C03462|nr:ABC transporter ATP-binding protein [Vibrio sp. 1CM23M]MCK8073692.1 ABC transporter ATP-binding protein [Vibrio sp. 1CM23M]
MNENIVLQARDLSLSYKIRTSLFNVFEHKAIDSLSLELYEGEVLGIIGRNGAGKSTLLKLLAGVLTPDSGEINVKEGYSRALLSLGLGFNGFLTGRDNAIISTMLNGYSKKEAVSLVDNIKEFSELGEFFEQPVRTYSNGMKSRLGFATGVLNDVDILMIDEILSVGDKKFKKKAQDVMLEKLRGNKSVLFVSHNTEQINKLCTRVVDLDQRKGDQ